MYTLFPLYYRHAVRRSTSLAITEAEDQILLADKSGDVYSFSIVDPQKPGQLQLGHLSMLLAVVRIRIGVDGANVHGSTCWEPTNACLCTVTNWTVSEPRLRTFASLLILWLMTLLLGFLPIIVVLLSIGSES